MSETSESIIEEIVENPLRQAVRYDVNFIPQYGVKTSIGNFRADFAICSSNHSIIIECDGAEFHDAYRDEVRDAAMLSQTEIDTIYRIPGTLVLDHHIDCIAIIALLEQDLFDPQWVARHQAAIGFDTSDGAIETLRLMDAEITVESFCSKPHRRSIGMRSRVRYIARNRYFWRKIASIINSEQLTSIDEYMTFADIQRKAFLNGSK